LEGGGRLGTRQIIVFNTEVPPVAVPEAAGRLRSSIKRNHNAYDFISSLIEQNVPGLVAR
jgi:hypothetical protein